MTVAQLVAALAGMPQDASVSGIADGAARMDPDFVYVSQGGQVILASHHEAVHYTQDRPVGAPTIGEQRYWTLP
jgi:hypothetical protein